MYNEPLKTVDFLNASYKLMLKKVQELLEIQNAKKVNHSLKNLTRKHEAISKILQVIPKLQDMMDISTPEGLELLLIFNDIGSMLTEASLDEEKAIKNYETIIIILEAFLFDPIS